MLKFPKNLVLFISVVFVIILVSLSTSAQIRTTSTQTNSIPSPTLNHILSVKACRHTFDWQTFITERRSGITNSNPYILQGCVEDDMVAINGIVNKTLYSQFTDGNKAVFGNDPVLGIFPNAGKPAQSINTYTSNGGIAISVTPLDRSKLSALITPNQIFTSSQLDTLFSTIPYVQRTTRVTGVPRMYSTGPDIFNGTVYQGGWCRVENGEIKVRTSRAGQPITDTFLNSQNRSATTPETSCARSVDGTRLQRVEDRPLRVSQSIYEYTLPTAAQCLEWFNVDATTCDTFFNNRYTRTLAGDFSGQAKRILSIETSYGGFDDQYNQWVGWANPDTNGPRKNSSDDFIKSYDGKSVYSMNN